MTTATITADSVIDASAAEETLKSITKYAKFAICLTETIIYGLDRIARFPQIVTETSGIDPAMNVGSPLNTFIGKIKLFASLVKVISYAVTIATFLGPVFIQLAENRDVKIFGIRISKDNVWLRIFLFYILLPILVLSLAALVYKNWDRINGAADRWKRIISVLSQGGLFIYGVVQVGLLISNFGLYENKKLFSISSAAKNLTAPLDMYGIDKWLYYLDGGQGYVYFGVYGVRTAIKASEAAGYLSADD